MGTYININDFQTISSPMPFQHFLGDYALTTTAINTTSTPPQTAEQCDEICKDTPNCEVWKRTSAGVCTTFMATGTRQSGIKINRATRFITGSSTVYSLTVPSTTATGSTAVPSGRVEDCETRCNDLATCGAYSFDTSTFMCSLFPTGGATSGNVGVLRDMFSDSSLYINLTAATITRTTVNVRGTTSVTSGNLDVYINDFKLSTSVSPANFNSAGGATISTPISPGSHRIQVKTQDGITVSNIVTRSLSATITVGTISVSTTNRTTISFTLTGTNLTSTDVFSFTVTLGTFSKNLTTEVTGQNISNLQLGNDCVGGLYTITARLKNSGVSGTSASFTLKFHLDGIVANVRAIYSTKTVVPNFNSNLFSVLDTSTTPNTTRGVISDPFGNYMFFGTTVPLAPGALSNLKVIQWFSQSGTSHLTTTSGTEPSLKLNQNEKFYYMDFDGAGTRFTLPAAVLFSTGTTAFTIHTNIKRFSVGSALNSILFGSGSSTNLRGGLWAFIENSSKKYGIHKGTVTASQATNNLNRCIVNDRTYTSSSSKMTSILSTTTVTNINGSTSASSLSTDTNFTGSSTVANISGFVGASSYTNRTNTNDFNGGLDTLYVYATSALTAAQITAMELSSS